jgi:hypothetical protein
VNAQAPNQPLLKVEADPGQSGSCGVNVCNLDPDLMVSLARHPQAGGLPHALVPEFDWRTIKHVGSWLSIGAEKRDFSAHYT